jgi:hypothetical protein
VLDIQYPALNIQVVHSSSLDITPGSLVGISSFFLSYACAARIRFSLLHCAEL